MDYLFLMRSHEVKEFTLLQYLAKRSSWRSYIEISRQTGLGISSIDLARAGIEEKIRNNPFGHRIQLKKEQGKRCLKLEWESIEEVEQFLKLFVLKLPGYQLIGELLLSPYGNVMVEAKKVGVSHTFARKVMAFVRKDIQEKGLQCSKRGFELLGEEERVREYLFQFFEPVYLEEFWGFDRISKKRCEKLVKLLIEALSLRLSTNSWAFQRLTLWVALFYQRHLVLKRSLSESFAMLVQACFKGEEEQLYTISSGLLIYIENKEICYLYYLILRTTLSEKVNEFPIIKEQHSFLEALQQIFLEEQGLKRADAINWQVFQVQHFQEVALTLDNIVENKQNFPGLFVRVSELLRREFKGEISFRPTHFTNTMIESVRKFLTPKRERVVFVDASPPSKKRLESSMSQTFREDFIFEFSTLQTDRNLDLILSTKENVHPYTEIEAPILFVNEELSYKEYLQIHSVLKEG